MKAKRWTLYLLPLMVLAAAACSNNADDGRVATVGGSGAPAAATPTLSLLEQATVWARCMREHGVAMPDPEPHNGDGVRFPAVDKDSIDAATQQAAEQACTRYRPVLPAADQAMKDEYVRQFARCMREEGVEEYPDPNGEPNQVSEAVRRDPQYDQAEVTCKARERAALASSRPSPTS